MLLLAGQVTALFYLPHTTLELRSVSPQCSDVLSDGDNVQAAAGRAAVQICVVRKAGRGHQERSFDGITSHLTWPTLQ